MRVLALVGALTAIALGTAASGDAGRGRSPAVRLTNTVAAGDGLYAHLWAAGAGPTGSCDFLTLDRRAEPRARTGTPRDCKPVAHLPPTRANRVAYTITGPEAVCAPRPGDCRAHDRTMIYGEIDALAPVARIVILAPGRSLPVTSDGHWLLGRLPSRVSYKHWRLVAYAASGRILGRVYF